MIQKENENENINTNKNINIIKNINGKMDMENWLDSIRKGSPSISPMDRFLKTAVLVPLIETEKGMEILFEVRSDRLKRQPGEICFPGGKMEEGESDQACAIRETMEELLIGREQLMYVGALDYLAAPSNLILYPHLALLRGYRGTFSRDEVKEVFTVPLSFFVEQDVPVYESLVKTEAGEDFPYAWVPGGEAYRFASGKYRVLFYHYEGRVIWGLTAKIIANFVLRYRQSL